MTDMITNSPSSPSAWQVGWYWLVSWFTSIRFLTAWVLGGGVLVRVWHYLANHTIWYDEAVLLDNILTKDYAGLLGPLRNEVAAPPLYLWYHRFLAITFGDEPYLWRLLPFLASTALLLLMVPLARRVLPPRAALLAVSLVAVSDNHIWLGCCVKPYASDALIFALLLLGYFRTEHWPTWKRLLCLCPMIPLLLGFSYAAPFAVGTVLLALLPKAYAERGRGLFPWLLAAGLAVGTLAVLYYGPIQAQRVPKLVNEWDRHYLNLAKPAHLPWWLAEHFLGVFHYCLYPSGAVLILVLPYVVWLLLKRREYDLLILLSAPFLLALAASAMKSYVFGHNRLMIFILPVLVLWCGKAFAEWLERSTTAIVIAVVLVGACDGPTLFHIFAPWDRPDAQSVTRFVNTRRQPNEPVYSNEDNYLYFFRHDLKRLSEAREVPVGQRVWVVMDLYDDVTRQAYIHAEFLPAKFELIESHQYFQAAAYLYERKE